jgi:hypothetical protein
MAAAAAWTSFEEKSGKVAGLFPENHRGQWIVPCLADPADPARASSVGSAAAVEAPFRH